MVYEWILANKEILKVVYALVIVSICAIIVLKTDRMFKLSDYQGLRYFRNAFFFYGLAFFVRFILGGIPAIADKSIFLLKVGFFFEFFIIVAGFFLLYSLIWKRIEKVKSYHSLLNLRALIFYVVALLVTFLDLFYNTTLLMYSLQIVLFATIGVISYGNFSKDKKKHKFLKYYFLVIILGLIAWVLNAALEYFLNWNKVIQMGVCGLNILFFVFFLYAITKITKSKNG